jgi:dihydroorotate dehydrogenase
MYAFLRRILFLFDAEAVHYFAMNAFKLLCAVPFIKPVFRKAFDPQSLKLRKKLFGLDFRNPVGLGAGFDKNAKYLDELEVMGFGFVEIGTVTPQPQQGNEKPRLFRLPEDKALVNRMGFNNEGVKVISNRLRNWRKKQAASFASRPRLIIGGNIGKNKTTPNEEAWKDYETCFRELFDCVDYFVVNVSSPNTPGLRALQEKEALQKILSHLQLINGQQTDRKPLLLKIAPDLTREQLVDVTDLALEIKLDGLVTTNTTIQRAGLLTPEERLEKIGAGGLSGKPLSAASTAVLEFISNQSKAAFPLIASGGIFNGEDALMKIKAGAALLQVWTGFIYEGPGIVKSICTDLEKELKV